MLVIAFQLSRYQMDLIHYKIAMKIAMKIKLKQAVLRLSIPSDPQVSVEYKKEPDTK